MTRSEAPSALPLRAAAPVARQSRFNGVYWVRLAVLAFLVSAPFIGLYPVFMMKAMCYAIFA